MAPTGKKLRAELRAAGISDSAIRAAWPSWWSRDAESSPSAVAELRFTLSRRLGLSATSLIGERVEFVWGDDDARFKHLLYEGRAERAALTSFAMVVGRLLIEATQNDLDTDGLAALRLREAILEESRFVDLGSLLRACWDLGIPVAQLRVFPLEAKGMHAMVVRADDRYAVLLARETSYPALSAFTLAHELGHIFLRHLGAAAVLVDAEEEDQPNQDLEEQESDRYALQLLTGSEKPDIRISHDHFNAAQLAQAAIQVADGYRIEPGTLALCVGFARDVWPLATTALRYIYGTPIDVASGVNAIANQRLEWDRLPDEAGDYLRTVLGIEE